jgi:putative transcriptional regulator
MTVKVQLKRIREDRKISQNALARSLEMSLNTVQRIESNKVKSIPFDTLDKICVALDCEVQDLLIRVPECDVA